jgi:hypothetical protein
MIPDVWRKRQQVRILIQEVGAVFSKLMERRCDVMFDEYEPASCCHVTVILRPVAQYFSTSRGMSSSWS